MLALREALARAERVAALGQVAANVAHQAGTPLNLVSGYVQMIRDDPQTASRRRAAPADRRHAASQVTRVLRTMLDRRAAAVARVPLDVWRRSIDRACTIARPRLCAPISQLEASVAERLPRSDGERAQLEMALLNLVTNALDAMPTAARFDIRAARCRRHGSRWRSPIPGHGIPPA